MLRQENSSNID